MENRDKKGNQSPDKQTRKTYVKPTYQSEEVFETMALSCGKVDSTQGQCHRNQKAS